MKQQQKRQAGFIVSAELVLIATILVIGLIVGMVAIRDSMIAEMGDVAEAIGAIDQSYEFNGVTDTGTNAAIAASAWYDDPDNTLAPIVGRQGLAGDQTGIDFETPGFPAAGENGL
jgi:hypothetical protein